MKRTASSMPAILALVLLLSARFVVGQTVIQPEARPYYSPDSPVGGEYPEGVPPHPVAEPGYDPSLEWDQSHGAPLRHHSAPGDDPWPTIYDSRINIYTGATYLTTPRPPVPARGSRSGSFQGLTATDTWLASDDEGGMGVHDVEFKSSSAVPMPHDHRLILTSGFGAHFFDGPTVTDVPGQTYDMYLDFRWMHQITPHFGFDIGVTPGWYTDFEQGDTDALRIGGRGAGVITFSKTFQLALGAMYLDRNDVSVLPLAGVIWLPNEFTRMELVFPRPKVAKRILRCHGDASHWLYLAGEFGGGSWAVARAGGAADVLNYRDYRVMLGLECLNNYGVSGRLEFGYVFGRTIDYKSDDTDFDIDDTFMARGELTF